MVGSILLRAAEFFSALPGFVKDTVFLALVFAPYAAFAAAAAVCACKRSLRARSKSWFLYLCCACCALSVWFAVFSLGDAAVVGAASAFAAFALSLGLYGALCLFGRQKGAKKPKRKKRAPLPEEFLEEEPAPQTVRPEQGAGGRPQFVRCFGSSPGESEREAPPRPLKDVRLDYVLSVAERLREMPLGAGDRLETEKMSELLQIYRNKGELSAKECETLNDMLAALLKMMAKYDV